MSIKDLKNTTVMSVQKFHTKYWIEGTYYSCSWRKRFNCDQCGKNFARGCYLKLFIEIVHEKNFEFNCDHCGKNFTKAFMNQTKHWIEITNYSCSWKWKDSILNFDQCGKKSARGCILNDHEIDSWIEFWKSLFLDLKLKKDTYKLFMKVFWFSLNKMWILWWYIIYLGYNLSFKILQSL